MARLEARDGRWFELTPVSYQFPGDQDDWDANWLYVAFAAELPAVVRRRTDPAFLTTELHGLAAWCRRASSGTLQADELRFDCIEPNFALSFREKRDDRVIIEIQLSHAFAPRSVANGFEPSGHELEIHEDQLAAFADELEDEMRTFPVVGTSPSRPTRSE